MTTKTTNIDRFHYINAMYQGVVFGADLVPHSYGEKISWRNPNSEEWHDPSMGVEFSDYQRTVLSAVAQYTRNKL